MLKDIDTLNIVPEIVEFSDPYTFVLGENGAFRLEQDNYPAPGFVQTDYIELDARHVRALRDFLNKALPA
jgi:hypothetical protein